MFFLSKSTLLLAFTSLAGAFTTSNFSERMKTKTFAANDEMSKALPFAKKPANLDGTFPGDVGFE